MIDPNEDLENALTYLKLKQEEYDFLDQDMSYTDAIEDLENFIDEMEIEDEEN